MHAESGSRRPFAFAGIDVGTNSVLLTIARPAPGGLHLLEERCVVTRLGQGLADEGELSAEAMERTLSVLEEFGRAVAALDARGRAAGTSALRRAANSEDFLGRAREVLGFAVEVLTGQEEARLGRAGALSGLEALVTDGDSPVVVDPGGGSTEIFRDEAPVSLELGSVRLTESFLPSDPPSDDELGALRAGVRNLLAEVPAAGPHPVVAVGGTATTLAALRAKLDRYDSSVVHGMRLSAASVSDHAKQLAAMPLAERLRLPCLPPGRADVIVAGSVLLEELLAALAVEECVVSDRGLRYGLVVDAIAGSMK